MSSIGFGRTISSNLFLYALSIISSTSSALIVSFQKRNIFPTFFNHESQDGIVLSTGNIIAISSYSQTFLHPNSF